MKNKNSFPKTLCFLTASSAISLTLLNRWLDRQACSSHLLQTDQGQYYNWKHGRVFYSVRGKGETPLLLLHSLCETSSSYEWHDVVSNLGKHFRLYIPDLPGCGRSDKPAVSYTDFFYVSFIKAFIRDVIHEKIAVVSSGMACPAAVMAGIYDSNLISQIIMINPPAPETLAQVPQKNHFALRRLLSLPVIGESIYQILTGKRYITYLYQEKYFHNPFKIDSKTLAVSREAAHTGTDKGRFLKASLDGRLLNWNINRALSLLSQDVIVIYGAYASAYKTGHNTYKKLCPKARLFTIPSCAELPALEQPQALTKLILTSCSDGQ